MKAAPEPWKPAPYEDADIGAIKALFRGDAEEHQQKRAIDWILFKVCGLGDQQYWPESQRDTDFALGKRFVALQIVKLSKLTAGLTEPPKRKRPNKGVA